MNANTYVDRPNDKGTALDRERQLATLLEDDDVLCAHVYDDSGYSEFLFHGSPENIANFIGARPMVHQIVLTDRQERPVLHQNRQLLQVTATVGWQNGLLKENILHESYQHWKAV